LSGGIHESPILGGDIGSHPSGRATEVWAASVGQPAPAFTATDTNNNVHKLSDYKGKFVVLEWTNRDCPFTQKHYQSGNMERLQHEWTKRGVVWLTVVSSAPGEQGYVIGGEENAYLSADESRAHCGAARSKRASLAISTTPRPLRICS
jgi:hypothetical protein